MNDLDDAPHCLGVRVRSRDGKLQTVLKRRYIDYVVDSWQSWEQCDRVVGKNN